MVPEAIVSLLSPREESACTHPKDAALVKELCTNIVTNRLAGTPALAAIGETIAQVEAAWSRHGAVVLSIHTESMRLIECWTFEARSSGPCGPMDLKMAIKSLLCYSKFHAWRQTCDPTHLRQICARVESMASRMQFDSPPVAQVCPTAALRNGVLHTAVETCALPVQDQFAPAPGSVVVVQPAVAKLLALRLSSKKDGPDAPTPKGTLLTSPRSLPKPTAASPDPRRRDSSPNTQPIAIPRRARPSTLIPVTPAHMAVGLPQFADGRIAPSPPAQGPVDHRGIFLSPPRGMRERVGSGSRPGSLSRTPPANMLGSLEESLLSGRLPAVPANPVHGFILDIGAAGLGRCQPHLRLPLAATYYNLPGEEVPTPYVGVVDLSEALKDQKHSGMYRVSAAGLIQVAVYNPEKTGIKVFLVKYDFRDMPPCTHTFLRQRTYVASPFAGPGRGALRYAVHLRFVSSRRGHVYLHKDVRVIFSHVAPDAADHVTTTTDGPTDPVYTPCSFERVRANKSIAEEHPGDDSAIGLLAGPSPLLRETLVPELHVAV
eukprot:m.237625 g.237625  ORF g.237625 m.237625 type:complete len:546 (-) comp13173_c0_seq1:176-1813(-)